MYTSVLCYFDDETNLYFIIYLLISSYTEERPNIILSPIIMSYIVITKIVVSISSRGRFFSSFFLLFLLLFQHHFTSKKLRLFLVHITVHKVIYCIITTNIQCLIFKKLLQCIMKKSRYCLPPKVTK